MEHLERRLDRLEEKIDNRFSALAEELDLIKETLKELAVQDERITALERDFREMRRDLQALVSPEGLLAEMRQFQASCPRDKVQAFQRYLVGLTIALVGGLLGMLGNLAITLLGKR